jgi:hypothetical protein
MPPCVFLLERTDLRTTPTTIPTPRLLSIVIKPKFVFHNRTAAPLRCLLSGSRGQIAQFLQHEAAAADLAAQDAEAAAHQDTAHDAAAAAAAAVRHPLLLAAPARPTPPHLHAKY